MKPWTVRKQIIEATRNSNVRIDGRTLADGSVLRGIYACKDFGIGDYVASYHGVVYSREQLFEIGARDRALFDRINEYSVVHAETGGHLFADDRETVGAHLINHSCGPNAEWRGYERHALLVRAVKPIKAGDEVTIHYGWLGFKAAVEGTRHACACGAPFCVGTIELNIKFTDHGDGTGSPELTVEEITRRFLADLANDTNENELLLRHYRYTSPADMMADAKSVEGPDPVAYGLKLRTGARDAVWLGREKGLKLSERRLQQIARIYDLQVGP